MNRDTEKDKTRRQFIKKAGITTAGLVAMSSINFANNNTFMKHTSIRSLSPLQSPWQTQDPFLFCAYHKDNYPGGNENLGPKVSLEGRTIGQDFAGKDGWNMYHGSTVPGFPAHPHSGFETVTIATKGMVDHSDSLGGRGRFGDGDVQWLTSGKGVQHAEMFPLLDAEANPFELFQIWLNLPAKSKKVDPYYKMLWGTSIPVVQQTDSAGKQTNINVIAGSVNQIKALAPTPDSWAADTDNHVEIWTLTMEVGASFTLPAIDVEVNRSLYFYDGESIKIDGTEVSVNHQIQLDPQQETRITNGTTEACFLFLQGRAINEPVIQYGPFVANTRHELQETMQLYQRTEFGGWPWPSSGPVHGYSKERFANDGAVTQEG